LRKAALAIAITLLLSLSTAPSLLSTTSPGSAPQPSYPGYAPQATDFIYPVGDPRVAPTFDKGNANGFYVSQMFNNSCDPSLGQGFYLNGEYFCGHTGVDLSDMQEGDTVRAVANGFVVFAGYNSTYGVMVRIQHLLPDGSYVYSQYEHMMYGSLLVAQDEVVTMGQTIGRVGSTGFVTGAHLHFEMKSVNEDGHGYTFGNAALIVGYDDPIQYIAAHSQSVAPAATATPAQSTPADAATPGASQIISSAAPLTGTSSVSDTVSVSPTTAVSATISVSPTTAVSATASTTATAPATTTTPISGTGAADGEGQGVLVTFTKAYTQYVTVVADQVNVRAGSGYRFTPLNSVTKGARLGYLGVSGDGWVHVALPSNVTGYIARQLVEGAQLPTLPPVVLSPMLHAPFVTVTDARYPARNGPLMRDMAVEPLWVGEKLPLLANDSRSPSWAKVALPSGRVGYVLNWYLTAPAAPSHNIEAVRTRQTAVKPAATPASSRPRFTLAGPFVVTTVDELHLRAAPRLGGARIETMSIGTKLHLRGYHVSWAAVTAPDGANGYVLGRFVAPVSTVVAHTERPSTPSRPRAARNGARGYSMRSTRADSRATTVRPRVSNAAPARYVVISVVAANVHTAPSRTAPVVASAPQGARLAVRGATSTGEWVLVEMGKGVTGWVMRALTH
jgi:murein DD-endopeptidase MepM/ murein hydrolase activator NlpD/uncharacterized protein YgiM (DUF1202 family)